MGVSIDSELAVLDRRVTALRVEYERFFAGDLKLPPIEERRKLEELLKRLANLEVDRAAERFRLQAVESRYYAFRELWEKRQRAREEGRRLGQVLKSPPPGAEVPAAAEAAPNATAPAPVKPVKRRVDLSPLFDRYCAARTAVGEDVSKLRLERFEELVRKQAEEIRKRTGCQRLIFEVQTVEGKVRLVGRPARQESR